MNPRTPDALMWWRFIEYIILMTVARLTECVGQMMCLFMLTVETESDKPLHNETRAPRALICEALLSATAYAQVVR